MVTIQEARQLLDRHFIEHPPAISGDLYIAPEWYEDELDYVPVWGSRQFYLDGVEAFARWDNLVIFINKQTGEIHEGMRNLHAKKVGAMTPVRVDEPTTSVIPDEVSAFIRAAADLPVESLAAIRRAVAEATAAGTRDAALAPKLDAAAFSALDKHVRDAFASRASELRSAQPGTLRAAIASTTVGAQAMWKRETLTPEQFDSYLGVFRAVGVQVDRGIFPTKADGR